jgi:signal transduction histidine kinase
MNLVSNAIKYTREDGLISVATEGKEAEAIVRVSDTGYGIPADELPYIFNRYRRVKGHRHLAVGTGLGLAIVKSLVEAHDGEILVESRENDGSVFIVRLPRDARRSLPS